MHATKTMRVTSIDSTGVAIPNAKTLIEYDAVALDWSANTRGSLKPDRVKQSQTEEGDGTFDENLISFCSPCMRPNSTYVSANVRILGLE